MCTNLSEDLYFDVKRLRTEPARFVVEDCVRDFISKGITLKDYSVYAGVTRGYLGRLFRTVLPAINESLYIEYIEHNTREYNILFSTSHTDRRDVYYSAVLLYTKSNLSLISCADTYNISRNTLSGYVYTRLPLDDLSLFKSFILSKQLKGCVRSIPADKDLFNTQQVLAYSKCIEIADLVINQSFSLNDIVLHFNMPATRIFTLLGSYLAPFDFDLYERTICYLKVSKGMKHRQLCKNLGTSILNGESYEDIMTRFNISDVSISNYIHRLVVFDYSLYLQVIAVSGFCNILDSIYTEDLTNN